MAMAKAAAELISTSLRHASGQPVECVIAETCISGAKEAADADRLFERSDVGLTLTVTPCWCYGSETIDMHPTRPKAIWGFNGTERPGAVYLAAALAGHAQKGIPCFGIYGSEVQDLGDTEIPDDVREKLLRFVRAGIAVATMKGKSYLALGGTSMGIAGSIVDCDFFEKYLGMRVVSADMSEFSGRILYKTFDAEELVRASAWVKKNCRIGEDLNSPIKRRSQKQKEADWRTSILMTMIARDMMVGNPKLAEKGFIEQSRGHNAIAAGFQGQRQWTDTFPNGDFMEAMLCSSFDWNGIRQPFVFATENDSLNAVSMLFGHLLTGTAQLFSDVRTYWSPESVLRVTGHRLSGRAEHGILHLINSGPSALDWTGQSSPSLVSDIGGNGGGGQGVGVLKPWWEMTPKDVSACLEATRFCPSITEYFPGGGWSTDFTTKGGIPITMCRVNLVGGLGPVLQIVEGWTVDLPPEVHAKLDERTNPTWPTTWFAPRLSAPSPFRERGLGGEGGQSGGSFSSVYSVMANWGANHGAICAGHIGADLITLASMLRIPVDMHNVETIFRPNSWSRFGTHESQGADFRACANYGPLYG